MVKILCVQLSVYVVKKKMQEFTSETEFKFEDGKVAASEKSIRIPCNIANKNVSLKTDAVKSETPLLLSIRKV